MSPPVNGVHSDLQSTENTQGTSNTDLQSIEADLARVSSVLSPGHNTDPEQELSEANVVELLQQLDNADGAMTGVEEKLNNVLGQLDSLLAALERKDGSGETDENSVSEN
ncbi:hypothetical protein Moror_7302 [Moniliophthora roreri MCA 2997]|uniref:Uncharacterized protein n=2 Tax=Moniliophthora roreri TaxID=221103 RepID=V2XTK2_MONRO|nr:hypothetical protein Moror_7302 [Moniliophthora roreri MCA 2997]